MFQIDCTGSFAISNLSLNPFTGTARVEFASYPRPIYRFTRVSRRALAKAVIGEVFLIGSGIDSVGQWVNATLWNKVR